MPSAEGTEHVPSLMPAPAIAHIGGGGPGDDGAEEEEEKEPMGECRQSLLISTSSSS